MNPHKLFSVAALLLALSGAVLAEDLDVTLTILEDEDMSEEVFVNEIALPFQAVEKARENAARGIDTSNQARQQGREFGAERAREARENSNQGGAEEGAGENSTPGPLPRSPAR